MGERERHERFARALDEGITHTDDDEFGPELTVVSQLRRAGEAPTADRRTRHDIATRISRANTGSASRKRTPGAVGPLRPRQRRTRPVLAATFGLLVGACAVAVLVATSALPGDALYPLKRAREGTVLALTIDDASRAAQRLDYAATRVSELRGLARHAGERSAPHAAYAAGLDDLDAAARTASRTLTRIGTNSGDGALRRLGEWSARQHQRLGRVSSALPDTLAHRQRQSLRLLERISSRAAQLRSRLDCYRITAGSSDELGALPATGTCLPAGTERTGPAAPRKSQPVPEYRSGTGTPSERPPDPEPPPHADTNEPLLRRAGTGASDRQTTDGADPVRRAADSGRPPARFRHRSAAPSPPPVDRPRVTTGDQPGTNQSGVLNTLGSLLANIAPSQRDTQR